MHLLHIETRIGCRWKVIRLSVAEEIGILLISNKKLSGFRNYMSNFGKTKFAEEKINPSDHENCAQRQQNSLLF
jgi:hypothetical protein